MYGITVSYHNDNPESVIHVATLPAARKLYKAFYPVAIDPENEIKHIKIINMQTGQVIEAHGF